MRKALMEILAGAPWLHAMARVFEKAGQPLYAVGGAVRNPLMGLPISDVDVCGPARPETVLALCEGTPVSTELRAAHFGTVELHITDEAGMRRMAEYTTFREDSYRGGHRPECVRFSTELAVDALRRDFSVNALYRRVLPNGLGEVENPVGGLDDLRAGVLHTVTPDPNQVLKDDGLRILRAARFQAELDLQPTRALMEGLRRHAPLLREIACERLRDELTKTLLADLRYPMLRRRVSASAAGLKTILAIGAWPFLMGGLPWDAQAVEALARLNGVAGAGLSPVSARMALLFWRGEALADALTGADALASTMKRLRYAVRETKEASLLCGALVRVGTGECSDFEAARMGRPAVRFCAAAFRALGEMECAARAEALAARVDGAPCSLGELNVNGVDLGPMLRASGKPQAAMGGLLNELWRQAAEGETLNERNALLAAAGRILEAGAAKGFEMSD